MKTFVSIGVMALLLAGALTSCQTGNYNATLGSMHDQGKETAADIPWIATKNTTRIHFSDPVQAAVYVSRTVWTAVKEKNRPGSIVLTDVDNWQIAAASADLIHHPNNGPVLFFTKEGIPSATLEEMKRLEPKGAEKNNGVQIVLVGPVTAAVEEQLKPLGWKTDRIEGSDPAAIAQAVDAYYAKTADKLPQSVIVASMEHPEFTIPAVNWIAHMPEPLLYVTKNGIPSATADALKKRSGKANIYLLGPESVISKKVAQELKAYGKVTRIEGNDPYENSVAFAKFKDRKTGFGWGITTPGHNLSFLSKDSVMSAIGAAPFSHLGKHAPLILTAKERMPDSVMNYVMSIQPKYLKSPTEGPYNHAWITGGYSEITYSAQSEIDDMMEIVPASGEGAHAGH